MKTFPWARAMEIGLGHLRLSPRDFWRMTLPELATAASAIGFGRMQNEMTRDALDALCAAHPDGAKGQSEGRSGA